jgi:hypothetical protein
VRERFSDLLSSQEKDIFLQVETAEWGLIDVTSSVEIQDRAVVHMKSGCDDVSRL